MARKSILGRKVGMTRIFDENGILVPATAIYIEPNLVLGNKTKDKDGYDATLVGIIDTTEKHIKKPQKSLFKDANGKYHFKHTLKELRDVTGFNLFDTINLDIFSIGEIVDVQGLTKGRGTTGAIKLWNFKIGPLSHGAGFPHRYSGSIAMGRGGSQAQRVTKGKKMAGHYGHELVTIHNLVVLSIDKEQNILLVKGAIPGPSKSVVKISSAIKPKKMNVEFRASVPSRTEIDEKELKNESHEQALETKAEEAKLDKVAQKQAEIEAEKSKQTSDNNSAITENKESKE